MVLALLLTAHADDSFTLMKETDACTIRKREKTETQGAAMWARCRWPELEPAVVRGMLTDLTRYDEWIWPIVESRVEREDAGRKLVYQRQHIFGLSDREVLLWVTVDDRPELAKVAWTAANDQPLALAEGAVRTDHQPRHVVTGDVLHHLAAKLEQFAFAVDDACPQYQITGGTCIGAAWAGQAAGEHPAWLHEASATSGPLPCPLPLARQGPRC